MYKCDECNNVFEQPIDVVYEVHTELTGSPKEYKPGCPKCKSPYIDDAYVCVRCGEYISASEAYFDGENVYCENCLEDTDEEEQHHGFDIFAELDKIFSKAFERGGNYG